MSVHAIVVSYHTGPVLWDCLSALDIYPPLQSITVVDNGNPADVSARLREWHAGRDGRELIRPGDNLGFGRACNRAAAAHRDGLILFINPDAIMTPDSLERLLASRARLNTPSVIGAAIVDERGIEQRGGRRGELTFAALVCEVSGLSRLGPPFARFHREREAAPTDLVGMPTISGACFLIDAALFHEVGGFEPVYFLHVEDIDLCRKVRAAGAPVAYDPVARVTHLGSTSAVSSRFVLAHKRLSLAYYLRRWEPGWLARRCADVLEWQAMSTLRSCPATK